MMTYYFNALREKGIIVIQEDTCWIDIFCHYVIDNKILNIKTLHSALNKTIKIIEKGQTTKDVIDLLKKFEIDYQPIEELYKQELAEWNNLLAK